jgi:hypothetical protein
VRLHLRACICQHAVTTLVIRSLDSEDNMSFIHWLIAAAMAALPFAASAHDPQQRQQQSATAASPDAPVQPLTYASAFQDYRPAADSKVSPDKYWRAANASVTDPGHPVTAAHAPAKAAPAKAVQAHAHDNHASHDMTHAREGHDE